MHLNTFRSRGHRTVEPQVMHRPVITSLLALTEEFREGTADDLFERPSAMESSSSVESTLILFFRFRFSDLLLPPPKKGKGWLKDRLCLAEAVSGSALRRGYNVGTSRSMAVEGNGGSGRFVSMRPDCMLDVALLEV